MNDPHAPLWFTAIVFVGGSALLFSPALVFLKRIGRSRMEFVFLCLPLLNLVYLYFLAWSTWPVERHGSIPAPTEQFRDRVAATGFGAMYIGWLLLGLLQLAAIAGGLIHLGVPWFLAGIIGLITTYVPILGTGLGIYGAINDWHLAWYWAVLIFFRQIPLSLFAATSMSMLDRRK